MGFLGMFMVGGGLWGRGGFHVSGVVREGGVLHALLCILFAAVLTAAVRTQRPIHVPARNAFCALTAPPTAPLRHSRFNLFIKFRGTACAFRAPFTASPTASLLLGRLSLFNSFNKLRRPICPISVEAGAPLLFSTVSGHAVPVFATYSSPLSFSTSLTATSFASQLTMHFAHPVVNVCGLQLPIVARAMPVYGTYMPTCMFHKLYRRRKVKWCRLSPIGLLTAMLLDLAGDTSVKKNPGPHNGDQTKNKNNSAKINNLNHPAENKNNKNSKNINLKTIKIKQVDSRLKYGLLNVRSAQDHTAEINDLIVRTSLDFLCLCETWIRPDLVDALSKSMCPPQYSTHHVLRPVGKRGGGICIVYRDSLNCRPVDLLSVCTAYERLAVSMHAGSTKLNFIIIYRPASNVQPVFFVEMRELLDEIDAMSGCPVVLGDFNTPSAGGTCDHRLLDLMMEHDLIQGVKSPTHLSANPNRPDSLLDLVFHPPARSGVSRMVVTDPGISDHRLITVHTKLPLPKNIIKSFLTRNIRHLSRESFAEQINNCSFITEPPDNVDDFCSVMSSEVVAVLDALAPEMLVTKRVGNHAEYTLSPEAMSAKRARRTLERAYKKSRTSQNKLKYNAACHVASRIIRRSKQVFIRGLVESAQGNSKKVWNICRDLLGGEKTNPIDLSTGLSATSFNNFFVDKLTMIKCKISSCIANLPSSQSAPTVDPPTSNVEPFSEFETVTIESVLGVLSKLNSKSSILDFIPTFLLKECAPLFAAPICLLSNMSFRDGIFPAEYKLGCITPILKKKGLDPSDHNSYRPITSLNTFSKLLEKIALLQLQPVIIGSPRFPSMQSAYRCAHSTETALLRVTSDIRSAMSIKKTTCLLSLDISAAFDALEHPILLARAETLFGISGHAKKWLASYLQGRTACTKIGDQRSSRLPCNCGVPQGSILGPLLFALYTAPLGELITGMGVSYHQYADDTQLYLSLNKGTQGLATLTACADAVSSWFLHNSLLLNTSKTECIIFGTGANFRGRSQTNKLTEITPFTGSRAPVAESVYLLGVTLDTELSMTKHVTSTIRSCNAQLRALRCIRPCLTQSVAATLAGALVQTRLDYCNSLLFSTSDQNATRLQQVQNNAARVVFRVHRRTSAAPLLAKLHWLPIESRIQYKVACLAHAAIYQDTPSYLSALISVQRGRRGLRSGSGLLLEVPKRHLSAEEPSFVHSAPSVWNSLSGALRDNTSTPSFRRALKTELFKRLPPSS